MTLVSIGVIGNPARPGDHLSDSFIRDPDGETRRQLDGIADAGIKPSIVVAMQFNGYLDVDGFPVSALAGMQPTVCEYVASGHFAATCAEYGAVVWAYGNYRFAKNAAGIHDPAALGLRDPAGFRLGLFKETVWKPWRDAGAVRYVADELGSDSYAAYQLAADGIPIGMEALPGINGPTGWTPNLVQLSKYPSLALLDWWRRMWKPTFPNVAKYQTYCLIRNDHLPVTDAELTGLKEAGAKIGCECLKDTGLMKAIGALA